MIPTIHDYYAAKGTQYSAAHGEHDKRVLAMKDEADMNGDAIKKVLRKQFEGMLTNEEKNTVGQNLHPFDFIVGEEQGLKMTGFEIKGDTDNYSRLPEQLKEYEWTFDNIYLVVHKKKPPEWAPYSLGVVRVFENGDAIIEKTGYMKDPLDISTSYEWDTLFKLNSISRNSSKVRHMLELIGGIRRNLLFNRFFGIHNGYNSSDMTRWWPLTEEQKKLIIGFDVPEHFKMLNKELAQFEKRLEMLKACVRIGQTTLKKEKVKL